MELQSLDVANKDVGYIEPRHGAKGRQMWLATQEDLPSEEMEARCNQLVEL